MYFLNTRKFFILKQKYGILLTLVLCASYGPVYGIRRALTCNEMVIGWIKSCFASIVGRRQSVPGPQFRYVKYYSNSKMITAYFVSGHVLNLPGGPTDYQAYLLQGVQNNFNDVLDENGNHPFYQLEPLYQPEPQVPAKKNNILTIM